MLLWQVISAPPNATLTEGVSIAIATTTAGALILITILRRGSLARFLVSLHIGQLAILMLPGILGLGFYHELLKGVGGGPYEPLVNLLNFLDSSGIVGGVVAAFVVGLMLCLPLQMLLLLWIWFGTKKFREKS